LPLIDTVAPDGTDVIESVPTNCGRDGEEIRRVDTGRGAGADSARTVEAVSVRSGVDASRNGATTGTADGVGTACGVAID
jgi:hypothetical protein